MAAIRVNRSMCLPIISGISGRIGQSLMWSKKKPKLLDGVEGIETHEGRKAWRAHILAEFRAATLKFILHNFLCIAGALIERRNVVIPNFMMFGNGSDYLINKPWITFYFNIFYRTITCILSVLALLPAVYPSRRHRSICILGASWSFYSLVMTSIAVMVAVWDLLELGLGWYALVTTIFTTLFVLSFHFEMMLQQIRFHEFLNFIN